MFIVTGSSGCGKSNVAQILLGKLNPYFIVDSDFLLHDIKGYDGSWDAFWNHVSIVSLTLARNLRPIAVVGRVTPAQIEKAKTLSFFSSVHYMVLTCDPSAQAARLKGRAVPGLLSAPTPDQMEGHIRAAQSIVEEGRQRPNATVLDNTDQTPQQTAAIVDRWILERLGGDIPERDVGQRA